LEGFGGVAGKPSSKPPKHLSSALNQANNFIFTVQGEFAGAIAFSNFNTLLAPFVREDDLSYNQVKQEIQQFIYNLNISTRVGFQCLSEDTEILSENGWVGYNDLKVGDKIITFNMETHNLEEKVVINMFKERYDGIMINLKNKITDQLITPNHRIIMKSFKENKYDFKLAENILEYKSDICLPISSKGTTSNLSFDINRIKFLAWFISEGTVDFNGRGNPRISIYQSNKKYLNEIKNLCDELELKYDEYFSTSGVGNGCNRIRFNSESFTKIISWFGEEILYKNIPRFIFKLSIECIETFIETYIKADGSVGEKYNRIRIYTNNENIRDALCEMLVLIGKSFTIKIRKSVPIQNYGGIKNIYVINVLKRKHAWITSKDKINYSGIVWCPTTENGTVIARRNGKCFITGNSPFSNLTLDLDTTKVKFADEPAIVGGELKDYSYGDCNKEATWISQAVVEVLSEGDAEGAMLSYPIVTFNVTKEFPWQNKLGKTILDATSKYGCFYFSNYINSDYSESDITSMCCRLKIDRREIQKHLGEYTGGLSEAEYDKTHQKGHGFFGASPNTGSTGVTTLNIPAIMYDAKEKGGDWDEFLTLVKYYMDLAIDVLMKKRKVVEEYMEKGLYPYARHYLREVKKRTGHYFTQHFSTICPNGVHEALYIYGFKDGIMCEDGLNKAIELLKFMNEYTVVLQKEHKVLVNLEQAPAESAGVKMCKKSGIDPFGNGYYTNSTWQPAEAKIDLVDLIEMQGKLNVYYSGGSSMHTYTDSDLVPVAQDLHKIIMFAFTETKIPYMTISPVFTVCPKCGRIAGKHDICPKCGSKKTEIYERIVGYYRPHTNWNKGRLKESEKRNYLKFDKK
jgi:ribonucleoside-triphosphate reductase